MKKHNLFEDIIFAVFVVFVVLGQLSLIVSAYTFFALEHRAYDYAFTCLFVVWQAILFAVVIIVVQSRR